MGKEGCEGGTINFRFFRLHLFTCILGVLGSEGVESVGEASQGLWFLPVRKGGMGLGRSAGGFVGLQCGEVRSELACRPLQGTSLWR